MTKRSDDPQVVYGYIKVRAESVKPSRDSQGNVEEGKFDLEIMVRRLSKAEEEIIEDLFPHLAEQAHKLLIKEALLACLD